MSLSPTRKPTKTKDARRSDSTGDGLNLAAFFKSHKQDGGGESPVKRGILVVSKLSPIFRSIHHRYKTDEVILTVII